MWFSKMHKCYRSGGGAHSYNELSGLEMRSDCKNAMCFRSIHLREATRRVTQQLWSISRQTRHSAMTGHYLGGVASSARERAAAVPPAPLRARRLGLRTDPRPRRRPALEFPE